MLFMQKEDCAIQFVKCLKCGIQMNLINEEKDLFNSDFYYSLYRCPKCDINIKILTHEWRD